MIKGGIAFPSTDIYPTTVTDRRFSSIPVYISFLPIGITLSSPVGIQTRAPFSSILCIYVPWRIFVISRAGAYSIPNQSRRCFSVYISTRWLTIGFVLIVWSSGVSRNQVWNHFQDGASLPSLTLNHIAQLYIICLVAPLPPLRQCSAAYRINALCCSALSILFCPPRYISSLPSSFLCLSLPRFCFSGSLLSYGALGGWMYEAYHFR
jgi:hypothetical protein